MERFLPDMNVRPAVAEDKTAILSLLEQARAFQIRTDNPQWGNGYPSADVIDADIRGGGAMVLVVEGLVAGYAAVVAADNGYEGISLWEGDNDLEWCSIHRFAISDRFRGQGMGRRFLHTLTLMELEAGAGEVRLDTGEENQPMRSVVGSVGYECLGRAEFPWGPRLAYRIRKRQVNNIGE